MERSEGLHKRPHAWPFPLARVPPPVDAAPQRPAALGAATAMASPSHGGAGALPITVVIPRPAGAPSKPAPLRKQRAVAPSHPAAVSESPRLPLLSLSALPPEKQPAPPTTLHAKASATTSEKIAAGADSKDAAASRSSTPSSPPPPPPPSPPPSPPGPHVAPRATLRRRLLPASPRTGFARGSEPERGGDSDSESSTESDNASMMPPDAAELESKSTTPSAPASTSSSASVPPSPSAPRSPAAASSATTSDSSPPPPPPPPCDDCPSLVAAAASAVGRQRNSGDALQLELPSPLALRQARVVAIASPRARVPASVVAASLSTAAAGKAAIGTRADLGSQSMSHSVVGEHHDGGAVEAPAPRVRAFALKRSSLTATTSTCGANQSLTSCGPSSRRLSSRVQPVAGSAGESASVAAHAYHAVAGHHDGMVLDSASPEPDSEPQHSSLSGPGAAATLAAAAATGPACRPTGPTSPAIQVASATSAAAGPQNISGNSSGAASMPRVRAFAAAHMQLHAMGSAADLASRSAGRSGALALAAAAEAAAAAAAARAQRLRAQAIRALGGAPNLKPSIASAGSAVAPPPVTRGSLEAVPEVEDSEAVTTPESESPVVSAAALGNSPSAALTVPGPLPLQLLQHSAAGCLPLQVLVPPTSIAACAQQPTLFSPHATGVVAAAVPPATAAEASAGTGTSTSGVRVKVLVIAMTGSELLQLQRCKLAALGLCVAWAQTRRRRTAAVKSYAAGFLALALHRHRASARACAGFSLGESTP